MKRRHIFLIVLLLAAVFTACTDQETVDNNNIISGNEAESSKHLTTFVASTDTDSGNVKTRSLFDYHTGAYYWQKNDQIFVEDDDGYLCRSQNRVTESGVSSFTFMVGGLFHKKDSYNVYYAGNEWLSDNKLVRIARNQYQKISSDSKTLYPGNANCAFGIATKKGDKFTFKLTHQSSILVLHPYTYNKILQRCLMCTIDIFSDNNIAGRYTFDKTTGKLIEVDELSNTITLIHATNPWSSFWDNDEQLTVSTTPDFAAPGTYYVHIAPGKHTLKIRYHLYDSESHQHVYFTQTYPEFDYAANNYYDMPSSSLYAQDYLGDKHYDWNAELPFWSGHEWNSSDPIKQPINDANKEEYAVPYKIDPSDPRSAQYVHDPNTGKNIATTPLFKSLPNLNEFAWYLMKGDIHYDKYTSWTMMGHAYSGGVWIKKKAKIAQENNITIERMKEVCDDNSTDLTKTYYLSENNELREKYSRKYFEKQGRPDDSVINDYFFVPYMGEYYDHYEDKYFWRNTSNAFYSSTPVCFYLRKETASILFYLPSDIGIAYPSLFK